MPTQIKINLCFKSVLGMTLNCIRWGSFGSGTEWCYPLPSLHPGPLWPGVVQPVRAPIKGTSRPASARRFGLDSILGEHKHRIQISPAKQPQITKHIIFDAGKNLATWGRIQRDERWRWSISKEKSVIFCWLTEVTLCHELPWITKWDQWLLKLLEKKSFLLAEYTSVQQYRTENYSISASATSPNPFRSESTHAASPVQSRLTAELQYQISVPQPCQV